MHLCCHSPWQVSNFQETRMQNTARKHFRLWPSGIKKKKNDWPLEHFYIKRGFIVKTCDFWEIIQKVLTHRALQSSFIRCAIRPGAACMAPRCDGSQAGGADHAEHVYSIRYRWLISFLLKWTQNVIRSHLGRTLPVVPFGMTLQVCAVIVCDTGRKEHHVQLFCQSRCFILFV